MPAVEIDKQGSNRFQLIDIAPLPGKCAVCGYPGNERRYIDFGMQLDYYGAVVFCVLCIESAAQVLGYASPDAYDSKIDTIRELKRVNEQLVEENDGFRDTINSLVGAPVRHLPFDESAFVESLSESEEAEQPVALSVVEAESATDEQGPGNLVESILSDDGDSDRPIFDL